MGVRRAVLGAVLAVLPVIAHAEPSYHRVIGVASDDTLNIRSEPSAESADIGDIAHDARHIEVLNLDPSGQWARIALAEAEGWISTGFLDPDQPVTFEKSSVPKGLVCGGTEPFWALELDEHDARFSHPEEGETRLAVKSTTVAEGRSGQPALITTATTSDEVIEATLSTMPCSDGMSDRPYGWTITLQVVAPEQRRFLSGCCHLPPE